MLPSRRHTAWLCCCWSVVVLPRAVGVASCREVLLWMLLRCRGELQMVAHKGEGAAKRGLLLGLLEIGLAAAAGDVAEIRRRKMADPGLVVAELCCRVAVEEIRP